MLQREMHRLERVIYYSFYRAIKRSILTDLESSKVLLKVLFSLLFLAALPVLAVLPEKNTKIRKTFNQANLSWEFRKSYRKRVPPLPRVGSAKTNHNYNLNNNNVLEWLLYML